MQVLLAHVMTVEKFNKFSHKARFFLYRSWNEMTNGGILNGIMQTGLMLKKEN